jgi:hypothetical protein
MGTESTACIASLHPLAGHAGGRFASVDAAMNQADRLLLKRQPDAAKPMTKNEFLTEDKAGRTLDSPSRWNWTAATGRQDLGP